MTLPAIEIVVGGALLVGPARWRRAAALAAVGLLVMFTVAIVHVVHAGINVDCGCFGGNSGPVTAWTAVRDLLMIAAAALVYAGTREPTATSYLALLALERRRALVDVGGDALLGVVADEELLLQLALERQARGEVHLEPARHGALDRADRLGRLARRHELPRVVGDGRVEAGVVDERVDQAERVRLLDERLVPSAMSSIALARPTRRARRCVPPVPGSTPSDTSGSPILALPLRAMRRSQAIATSSPPPTQWPLMRGDHQLRRLLEAAERLVGVQAEVVLEASASPWRAS